MRPMIRDGWLVVPFSGNEFDPVHMAVGNQSPKDWKPAFLDWLDGHRVAKIRPPERTGRALGVWLRVGSNVTHLGKAVV